MIVAGLYINDKVKHLAAFSLISAVLTWFLGFPSGVLLSLFFSVVKGVGDWAGDVEHSKWFLTIRTVAIPSEFLLDQAADIVGIGAGTAAGLLLLAPIVFS